MQNSNQYPPVITSNIIVTIASSASLSNAIDLSGTTFSGYVTPAAWTSANITFQASVDGTNFFNLYDSFGNEVTNVVSTSRFVSLVPSDMASIRYLKFRSGTSATPVSQAAERQITIVTRTV